MTIKFISECLSPAYLQKGKADQDSDKHHFTLIGMGGADGSFSLGENIIWYDSRSEAASDWFNMQRDSEYNRYRLRCFVKNQYGSFDLVADTKLYKGR